LNAMGVITGKGGQSGKVRSIQILLALPPALL
jgi:hypothetical protein